MFKNNFPVYFKILRVPNDVKKNNNLKIFKKFFRQLFGFNENICQRCFNATHF